MRKLKIFLGVSLAITALVLAPKVGLATTTTDLQAMIQSLMAQIQQLQTQLQQQQGSQPVAWCHTFKENLRITSYGSEVEALQTALRKDKFKLNDSAKDFGESTASAVVGFQEKYKEDVLSPNGLFYGTGFVGPSTRAKLNKLYGCGNTVVVPPVTTNSFTAVVPPGTTNPFTTPPTQVCVQVITPAKNNTTGECKNYSTPCDVPSGWTKVSSCVAVSVTYDRFAKCLAQKNVTMYGNENWVNQGECTYCTKQKELFGDSFKYVPHVDCATNASTCSSIGITGYPTWVMGDGSKVGGMQSLTSLAQKSDCLESLTGKISSSSVSVTPTTTQPSITVLSPNGGEVLQVGQTYNIKWETNYGSSGVFSITLKDIGTGKEETIGYTGKVPEQGKEFVFSWIVPKEIGAITLQTDKPLKGNNLYKIGVHAVIGSTICKPGYCDDSDATFTINPIPSTTVTPTFLNSGVCYMRSAGSVPSYATADTGSNYAKTTITGISTYNEVKQKCTNDVFTEIMKRYCQNNSVSAQWSVNFNGTNGCSASGCSYHSCAEITGTAQTQSSLTVSQSPNIQDQNILINMPNQLLGGFNVNVVGGTIKVSKFAFGLFVEGAGGTPFNVTDIVLYDSTGMVVAGPVNPVYDGTDAGMIIFNEPVIFPTGSGDYVLKGKIGNTFIDGQKIYIRTAPFQDWTNITNVNNPGGSYSMLPKASVILSTMTLKTSLSTSANTSQMANTLTAAQNILTQMLKSLGN